MFVFAVFSLCASNTHVWHSHSRSRLSLIVSSARLYWYLNLLNHSQLAYVYLFSLTFKSYARIDSAFCINSLFFLGILVACSRVQHFIQICTVFRHSPHSRGAFAINIYTFRLYLPWIWCARGSPRSKILSCSFSVILWACVIASCVRRARKVGEHAYMHAIGFSDLRDFGRYFVSQYKHLVITTTTTIAKTTATKA